MPKDSRSAYTFRTIYEARFDQFVGFVFECLFPRQTLVESFHIDVVCNALSQLLRSDEFQGLTINLPPRTLKSVIASVAFPLFALIHNRDARIIVLSGTHDLNSELIKNIECVLRSPRFVSIFGDLAYRRQRSELRFSGSGAIQFQVYGLDIIGKGFDYCVIDDPQSPADSKIERSRQETNSYFDSSVLPRMNDRNRGRIVLAQQRLHNNDLSGHVARQQRWNRVSIPAIAMHDEIWPIEGDWALSRAKGQPLCDARETRRQSFDRLQSIRGNDFMAQYQQEPSSETNPTEFRGAMIYRKIGVGPNGPLYSAAPSLAKLSATGTASTRVFGVEPSYSLTDPAPQTLEEWEAETIVQQAALVASSRDRDRTSDE